MPTRSSVQEPLPPAQRGSVPRGSPVGLGKTGSFGGDYGSLHGKSAFGLSVTPAVKVGRGTLVGLAGGTSFARGTSSERTREEAKRHLSRLSVVLAAHHTTSPSLQTLGAAHAQRGQPGGLSLVGLVQHRLEQQQQQARVPTPEPAEQLSIPIAQPQPPPPPLPTAQVAPRGLPSPSCSSSSISSAAVPTSVVDPAAAALAYEATCAKGSALFRKLCGTYSSLYRIAKTSPLPHLLCLPCEGGDGAAAAAVPSEADISYYDVQGHMLAPEIVGDVCHSPLSQHPPGDAAASANGDDQHWWDGFTFRSLRSDGNTVEVVELPGDLIELHIGPRGAATAAAAAAVAAAASAPAAAAAPQSRPASVAAASAAAAAVAAAAAPTTVVAVESWHKLPGTNLVVLWVARSLTSLPGGEQQRRRGWMSAAGTAAGRAEGAQRQLQRQSFLKAKSTPGSLVAEARRAEVVAKEGPTVGGVSIGAKSMAVVASRPPAPPQPPPQAHQPSDGVSAVTAEIDEETMIMSTHYFFPPKPLCHLTTQKVSYLCEQFAKDVQDCLTAEGRVTEEEADVVAEQVEQEIHEYILGALRSKLFPHWLDLHSAEERAFQKRCVGLLTLSWDDWQIPEHFRGDQSEAIAAVRGVHLLPTPLAIGRRLAETLSIIINSSPSEEERKASLATEASADLLLPLMIRVVVFAAAGEQRDSSSNSVDGDDGAGTPPPPADVVPFLTTLAYVRDFACPSMGYSEVAYAMATYEASVEFISSL